LARAGLFASTKALKLFLRYAELTKDFEEQGRPDLAAAMKRDRDSAAIRMVPALVTARLS